MLLLLLMSILGLPLLLTSSSDHSAGLYINCSFLNLQVLPSLPPETTELHIQDNQLLSIAPGQLDKLVSLKKLSLTGNPFHCDCGIQYLRSWMLKNRALLFAVPVCASPSSVAHMAITELPEEHFSSCGSASCAHVISSACLGAALLCLIPLLLWSLKLARSSTFILDIDERHSGFRSDSLRSLRPKHRRRFPTRECGLAEDSDSLSCPDDSDRPPVNMELLPQMLGVLQKKHNIKIKAT